MTIKSWIIKQMRKRSKVYVLPTKMGGYLNGLIFLMFLLSVGYSNNLLLIFTLFLFALNLTWVIQTHFYLKGFSLGHIMVLPGHAGEMLPVKLSWKARPDKITDLLLSLENNDQSLKLTSSEALIINKRGMTEWKFLKVITERPFGLYKVWVYFPVNVRIYSYPQKKAKVGLPDFKINNKEGDQQSSKSGSLDIINFGPYQGEASRMISWKHYARTGDLLIKEGEEQRNSEVHFTLSPPTNSELKEDYLSIMASQMVYLEKENIPFHLRTQAGDKKNLHDCLKELCQC